ncbi:MAG: MarR family winged helix-turn-helix transcriptional regulator [Planctomycetaceae bacterium]
MNRNLALEIGIAAALRQISRAADLHSRDLLQRHGLTGPQLATLVEIERGQPVSVGKLASQIHAGAATVTGIVDRLLERGLVCRERDADDRRTVRVSLTDAGKQLFASAPSPLCETFRERLRALPEWEQTNLLGTLQRIASMMERCP